jgi:hypothetical protein
MLYFDHERHGRDDAEGVAQDAQRFIDHAEFDERLCLLRLF